MVNERPLQRVGEWITKRAGGLTAEGVFKRLEKLNVMDGLTHATGYGQINQPIPPYQRTFSPLWIYKIRRDSPLMNNAMRQKIWQTFREGLSEWQKEYDAKCPACLHEFNGLDKFRQQMEDPAEDAGGPDMPGMEGPGPMADGGMLMDAPEPTPDVELDDDDIDLDAKRVCPECEEVVEMLTPDPDVKNRAQSFFDRANVRDHDHIAMLEPSERSTISQKFIDVLEEIAWDIQSFDDGWMLFERSYTIDEDGYIHSYELENVMRGPPELMRWSLDEERNEPGGNWWVCVKCRSEERYYEAQQEEGACEECGNVTYPAYAVATEGPSGRGHNPTEWFIAGEFYKDSEYERKRWYGYSPVLTLWEESRTVEQMDKWYADAYEERRAPRGVITVNAARDEELRQMNRQQMEMMREDPNYIPLMMNDHETEGDPIQFIELLSDPAAMQHMEMREWFLDRIGAHFGVTAILMESRPGESGLGQSMEVQVSEKQAEHFREILNGFVDAFLAQIGTEGWTRELLPVEEEDPEREAQLVGQHLNNAQQALSLGREVEWTDEDRAEIKPGEMEAPDEGMAGFGGADGAMGIGGGLQGPRGPEPGSLGPGEDPNAPNVDEEGERAREGPADEDRPSAQPLKGQGDAGDRLEKIAHVAFQAPREGEDVHVSATA